MRRASLSLLFLAVLLAIPGLASAETIDRIAAIVGDDVITYNDLRIDGRIRLASTGVSIDALERAPNRKEQIEALLKRMIQTRLLVQEANKMQAPVGAAEVDERLQMIYDRFNKTEQEYRELMAKEGIPWDSFRRFLRDELKTQFVIRTELGGQANVSDADIEACARQKLPAGKLRNEYTVRQLLVVAEPRDEELGTDSKLGTLYAAYWDGVDRARYSAARNLYEMAIQGDVPFEELATKFSSGRSRERGGLLGTFARGDLASDFDPIFDLKAGQISDIIETSAGFHILRIDAIAEVNNKEWDKTLQQCESELMQEESAKVIDSWLESLGEKSFVETKLFDDLSQP